MFTRGGTEGGAGGAIAPPLFPEAGHSPATRFNECGKWSSGAITHYVACRTGATRPGSDLFTNSQCLPEVENDDDLGELVLEGDDDLDCLSILTG